MMNWIQSGSKFFHYMGFGGDRQATWWGWLAAIVVGAGFVSQSLRLPSVRANLFRLSGLKLLGLAVAIAAGILEKVVFRKWVVDWVLAHGLGWPLQVAASAAAFGLMHAVWGLMGRSMRAAVGATLATGTLGAALALVYVVSGRVLAPGVMAHFAINALIVPGLVLAATRGEMSATSRK